MDVNTIDMMDLIRLIIDRISITCRTEWGIELPFDIYRLDTCARCYHYMPENVFKAGAKFSYMQFGHLIHPHHNITLASNETKKLSHTFQSISMILKWQQCCYDAILCCINYYHKYHHEFNMKTTTITNQNQTIVNIDDDGDQSSSMDSTKQNNNNLHINECPPTWDGWLCWDEYAKPSQQLERPCPKHIYWDQHTPPCRGYVTKLCDKNGHWFMNDDHREWSNYTMCARDDIYAGRIRYSLVTNIISMCALIPALFIFSHYKQVSSISRIRLHKHLFTSLLFHAIISALLKWHLLGGLQSTIEPDVDFSTVVVVVENNSTIMMKETEKISTTTIESMAVNDNNNNNNDGGGGEKMALISSYHHNLPSFCLILSILQRYFRSTNYLWMFNEAVYLHQLIKHAFVQPSLRPLIILAYSLPFITTTSYIFAREFFLQQINTITNEQSQQISLTNNMTNNFATIDNDVVHSYTSSIKSWKNYPIISRYQQEHLITVLLSIDDNIRQDLVQELNIQHLHLKDPQLAYESVYNHPHHHHHHQYLDQSSLIQYLLLNHRDVDVFAERYVSNLDYGKNIHPKHDYNNVNDNNHYDDDNHSESLTLEEDNPITKVDDCWLTPSNQPWHEWIINGPNLAVLIINCFFLIWLLRVLCIKAAATSIMVSTSPPPVPPPLPVSASSSRRGFLHNNSNNLNNKIDTSSTGFHHHHHHSSSSSSSPPLAMENNDNNNNNNNDDDDDDDGDSCTTKLQRCFQRTSSIHSSITSQQPPTQPQPPPQPPQPPPPPSSSSSISRYNRTSSTLFNRQSFLVSLRAAVLLLPLYGLHYLFIVYRPKIENCWLSETYHYLSLSFDGLQGLMVSIIFCFANSEIRNLLTRSFQRVSNRQRSVTIYMSDIGQINGNRD
ncbi:calcitonin related peptide type 1 receptor [Dermatophagoides farinae]|uniref:Calcitonin related peptide type 1 receptor n=1 Tax=Dermatophagoides farinae TaxID=6954 RepID=A0A9D4NXA7_DERFA|nr:calcitonin related peptide type 1 receptor [Dermatophagoides farinae]